MVLRVRSGFRVTALAALTPSVPLTFESLSLRHITLRTLVLNLRHLVNRRFTGENFFQYRIDILSVV